MRAIHTAAALPRSTTVKTAFVKRIPPSGGGRPSRRYRHTAVPGGSSSSVKLAQDCEIGGDAMLYIEHLKPVANAQATKMSNAVKEEKWPSRLIRRDMVCPMLDIIGLCGPSHEPSVRINLSP
jgi:hypothetical protein